MIIKLFKNAIAIVLSILIFTVLIKLDYGYATSSFTSIIGGLFLRVYLYKNYQFIYQKALLILFVSFISIPIQSLCLQIFNLQLRFSQLIAIVFCYVIFAVLSKYINLLNKLVISCLMMSLKCYKKIDYQIHSYLERYNKICVISSGIVGFFLFYVSMICFAEITFSQYGIFKILLVAIVFLSLFIFLLALFMLDIFKTKIYINTGTILSGICIAIVMVLFAHSILCIYMVHGGYDPIHPLLDAQAGLWNQDTAYHVALINSIINFGYPSVGISNTPVTVYHVLSHYIDAFLILITSVDPYQSVGLFFVFKTSLLLSSLLFFLIFISRKISIIYFLLVLIMLFYYYVGMSPVQYYGLAVASEALWFTSVLMLVSFNKVMDIVKHENYSFKNFLILTILILFIIFGKISEGFIYAIIIGLFLVIKFPKNIFIYITGIIWLAFLYFFQHFLTYGSNPTSLSNPSISGIINYLVSPNGTFGSMYLYYLLVPVLVIQYFLTKYSKYSITLTNSIIVVIIISILVSSNILNFPPDIGYFEYALATVICLILFHNMIVDFDKNRVPFYALVIILVITSANLLPNKLIKFNIAEPLSYQPLPYHKQSDVSLLDFRDHLKYFMKYNELSSRDTIMYIPENIYKQDLQPFNNPTHISQLIYAINRVPLLYGVYDSTPTQHGFGLDSYGPDAYWKPINMFSNKKACIDSAGKNIIVVDSYKNSMLSLIRCSGVMH